MFSASESLTLSRPSGDLGSVGSPPCLRVPLPLARKHAILVLVALRMKKHWWGVVLDAPDGPELARFYARLLGWQIFNEDEDEGGAAVAPSEEAGYYLGFQTEEKYVRPVWPTEDGEPQMSLHLDIEVDDLDEAVAHALAAGAELASYQPQQTVRVMLDPAGHPFCLYLDPGGST
jgi:predicted enzyme related to lactoylglutathione lyase